MDKVEEILPRISAFLKDDLSKEPLSSKAEKKRLYYVTRIEEALQEAAAQEIILKYEPLSGDTGGGGGGGGGGSGGGSGGVERRTTVVRGNVLPTPFNRVSFPPAEKKTTVETKQVMVAYETLPCDQTYEEVRPRDVYEDATLHGTSETLPSLSSHSTNGMKSSIVHPPHPPPAPPSRPVSLPPLYDEAFQSNPEKIEEASDSDTDYEEYAEAEEKDDDAKSKTSNSLQHDSQKLHGKVRQHSATTDLKGKRHSGYLHQKGTFQFQRRFCALCGTRFLCCKSERSLKVIVEVDVKEYEVVQQERREGKTASYPHELRFSCPGKETFLFYTESRQCAEDWVKEIRRATTMKQDSVEASATDSVDSASLNDDADRQSENGETNISGGSIEKVKALIQNAPDDGRKESKLSKILTFGKKLGNKTKNLFQSVDLGNIQTVGTEQEFGYVSIRSEEFTGDRWFRRFCRIESGHLNCYTDQSSTDVRPEFSIDLRGAQLKPSDDETNELKIKLVKDGKEHCLKMTDTLHHGQWLVSLIKVTGYGDQLKNPKVDIYEQPNLYEQPFLVLSDATEDDSILDEEPPPLPTESPPASPMPGHENSSRGLQKNPDPEGIYLQPSQWIQDVEELKRNKRRKPQNVAPVPVQEECAYMNRDFVRQALDSRGPTKDSQTQRGSINSSSSYPNLSSVGMDSDCESKDGSIRTNVTRGEAGPGAGSDSVGGRTSGKFRPSSALVESLENLTDDNSERSGRKNCRGVGGVAKGSSLSFDRGAIGLGLNQPLKKHDEQGWPRKSQSNTKIMWDELMRSSRSRTSGSESSDDLNNKKMVQNLVQMFEKRV